MHMVAKRHCRVHYGDGTDEQKEPELDEFYDYSSRCKWEATVTSDHGMSNNITLGCGGSELVITRATDDGGMPTKALGSREVKHDYTCLYCNINCQPFESLEAVRMHMVAKSHCRVHYGDGTDEQEEPELDEFYDYSSSYVDANGKQLVTSNHGMRNIITLGCGGSELVITRATDDGGMSTKALGSREYLRYYRQKPRPSPYNIPVTSLRAARYRSMGLSTLQLKEKMERMKLMKQIMKQMNRLDLKFV